MAPAAPRGFELRLALPDLLLVQPAPGEKPLHGRVVVPRLAAEVVLDLLQRRALALSEAAFEDHQLVALGHLLARGLVVRYVGLQQHDGVQ